MITIYAKSHKQAILSVSLVVLVSTTIMISYISIEITEVRSQTLRDLTLVSNVKNSTSINQSPTTVDEMLTLLDPIYEITDVKVLSQRVLAPDRVGEDSIKLFSTTSDYPQIEITVMENGILRGIGNVTNIGTWIDTYRAEGLTFNVGHGIMSTIDGKGAAPWQAYDIGITKDSDNGGNRTFDGFLIFNNNTTGELEFLSNAKTLYKIDTGERSHRMWLWD